MKSKVIIDPLVDVYYAGFYIQGLFDKFGKKNIIFKSTPFYNIENRADNFNFIISCNGKDTKYSIHVDDPYNIKKELYEWCDVYGNVNANFDKTPVEFHPKLVSLVPSFGIRLWNLPETLFFATENLFKINKIVNFRKFLGKYKRQWSLRLPYEEYFPNNIINQSKPYIFHLSTLWYNDEWNKNDEGVNKVRANFIQTCKSIDTIYFEGGLSVSGNRTINPRFESLVFDGFMSIRSYLEKIKQSVLVFNTPAFWDCHGWKLGEYLALGKAIISTPLSNDLPAPLVHGESIHYVENNEIEIKKAILLIVNDVTYRQKLEKGARIYWEKYGAPLKSLELLGL